MLSHSDAPTTQRSFLSQLKDDPRRISAAIALGFSTGLPFLLVYSTQSAWLYEEKVPIETIGLLSEMTLAYKFKWIWAPFLDEYDAPIFSRLLGRRRGWIVVSQIAVILGLAGVAWRSRKLADLDCSVLLRTRDRGRYPRHQLRWLAHYRGAQG